MSQRPWFPMFPADYLTDTAHLTFEEHGMYMLMLQYQWLMGSLPRDPADLSRTLRGDRRKVSRIYRRLRPYFVETSDRIYNEKLAKIRSQVIEDSDKNRERGRRGGQATAAVKSQRKTRAPATVPAAATQTHNNISDIDPSADAVKIVDTAGAREPGADAPQHSPATGGKAPAKLSTRMTPDWQPSADLCQWATTERPDLDVNLEIAKCREYYLAKDGAQATRTDWDPSFQDWILRARPYQPKPNGGNGASPTGYRNATDVFTENLIASYERNQRAKPQPE